MKYEEIYLHAYEDMTVAKGGLGPYFGFFNDERPHQALGYSVPSAIYFESLMREHGLAEAA